MPKISVTSPSNREDGLKVVYNCLIKQTFKNFEWLICSPYETEWLNNPIRLGYWFPEPEKKQGDLYNLNKCWNILFNNANGELVVSIVDYTEFEPNTLELLWEQYINNPTVCISGIGYQIKDNEIIWKDPRRTKIRVFQPINPTDMEFRLASVPLRGIKAAGGMEEEYDKYPANSEKELCLRLAALGYRFCLDQNIVYKFYEHGGHNQEWKDKYEKSLDRLEYYMNEIVAGRRLRLNYVSKE